MRDRVLAAAAAIVLPVLALAQPIDSRASNPLPVAGEAGGGRWLFLLIVVAAAALAFWGLRTLRRRGGPHGPQAPTPRGP